MENSVTATVSEWLVARGHSVSICVGVENGKITRAQISGLGDREVVSLGSNHVHKLGELHTLMGEILDMAVESRARTLQAYEALSGGNGKDTGYVSEIPEESPRHKWFVFVECCRLGIPWLGIVHDLSKFLPSEWLPYARYFYGKWPTEEEADRQFPFGTVLTKEKVAAQFDVAWLHHQHRNKHHWLRWLLTLDSARSDGKLFPVAMPDRYRREMLADWRGAGRAYGTPDTRFWYLVNRDKMQLHPETRAWVEEQLGIHDWLAGTREPIVVPLRRRRGLCLWWAKLKTLPRHYEIGRRTMGRWPSLDLALRLAFMRTPQAGQASREFQTVGQSVRVLKAAYLEALAPLLSVLAALCQCLTGLLKKGTRRQ